MIQFYQIILGQYKVNYQGIFRISISYFGFQFVYYLFMDLSEELSLSSSDFTSNQSSQHDPLGKGTLNFDEIVIIEALKFQNTVFKSGDDVCLRLDPKEKKLSYGKILIIAMSNQTQFPIIQIAWYYSKFDGFTEDEKPEFLADRELVLTGLKDWQYSESIVKKINVLSLSEYEELTIEQRKDELKFFSRFHLTKDDRISHEPHLVCHCLREYNPDKKLTKCTNCQFLFHGMCASHNYLCLFCQ